MSHKPGQPTQQIIFYTHSCSSGARGNEQSDVLRGRVVPRAAEPDLVFMLWTTKPKVSLARGREDRTMSGMCVYLRACRTTHQFDVVRAVNQHVVRLDIPVDQVLIVYVSE